MRNSKQKLEKTCRISGQNKRLFSFFFLIFMIVGSLKSQDDALVLRKANQLLTIAQERDRVSLEELEDIKSRRLRMEEDLLEVQDNPKKMSKDDKQKLEKDIATLAKHEEVLIYKRKYANNLLLDVTNALAGSPKKRAKFIAEYEKRVAPIPLETEVVSTQAVTETPPSVFVTKTAKDPIAQLENQSSSLPKKETVAENTTSKGGEPEPKPKKETPKKPKAEKQTPVVAKAGPKKIGYQKPKEDADFEPKPVKKVEKTTDVTAQSDKNKKVTKPKKEVAASPKTEENLVFPTVVVQKQPDAVSETTQKQPDALSETAQKQADAQKKMVQDLTESVAEPIVVIKKEKPAKEPKVKKPKAPIPSVRVPSETVAAPEPKKPKKEEAAPKPKQTTESSKTAAVVYKKWDAKDDVIAITPSTLDCNLAFDGVDNFTGKKKQETTPITLFAHTDDFMRATMKNKEYVTCEAAATRVEGSRIVYLNLTITVQTKDAQRTFGFLDRGALFIFRFINGKKMSLTTNKTDIGIVDVDKGTTTFRAQLAISETVEYTASELDAIRVSWSVGYEDYEIYDMDILRNLFKCLDKK